MPMRAARYIIEILKYGSRTICVAVCHATPCQGLSLDVFGPGKLLNFKSKVFNVDQKAIVKMSWCIQVTLNSVRDKYYTKQLTL